MNRTQTLLALREKLVGHRVEHVSIYDKPAAERKVWVKMLKGELDVQEAIMKMFMGLCAPPGFQRIFLASGEEFAAVGRRGTKISFQSHDIKLYGSDALFILGESDVIKDSPPTAEEEFPSS